MKRGTNATVKKGLRDGHNAKRMFDDAQVWCNYNLNLKFLIMLFFKDGSTSQSVPCQNACDWGRRGAHETVTKVNF